MGVQAGTERVGEGTSFSFLPSSCKTSERKSRGGKAEARSRGVAKEKTLECGQIVWGLAFSAWPAAEAGEPEPEPACAVGLPCLILATGLNDGHIKVWEVQTGEPPSPTAVAASGWGLSSLEGGPVFILPLG